MKKVVEVRKANGFSLQDMADVLGVSKTFYWQIENEKRRLSYINAIKIANKLNVKPDFLFYDEFIEKLKKEEI